jgi:phosphomannomutase
MHPTQGTRPGPEPIHFGTDGWRGVIAEMFTFANVARVAQANARYWQKSHGASSRQLVIVGYDRRFLSERFAELVAEVLAGNGFEVWLARGPYPTPALSLAVARAGACGGVMITASHNPAEFNGYKIKDHRGAPASDAAGRAIEALLDAQPVRRLPLAAAQRAGLVRRVDLRPAHYRAVRRLVDFRTVAASGLRLAHDAMFGNGAGVFADLLAGTRCTVTGLRQERDPLFGGIRPEPIAENYAATRAWLRRHPQDLCLVTDGDADRLGALEGRGRSVTGNQLVALLVLHLTRNRGERGRLLKTVNTTTWVDHIAAAAGLPLIETPIGFKHLAAELLRGDTLLAGEETGSIGLRRHLPERDGLAAGLMLLELLATTGRSLTRWLHHLEREFGPRHYDRIRVASTPERNAAVIARCLRQPPARLLRSPVEAINTLDGVKFTARDGSWLMLRGSGTEPALRLYAETASPRLTERLLAQGRRLASGG